MDKSAFNVGFQNTDLPSKIVSGLERTAEAFKVLLWDHAKKFGFSPIQIQILIFLNYHDESICNVSSLAKEFNVTKPTISDAIKVLDKKGMINKITSSFDKRAYSILLSREGKKIVTKTKHFADPIKSIVNKFSSADQIQFFESLSKLIHQLNKAEILTVQRTCFSCKFYRKDKNRHFCKLLDIELLNKGIRIDCPEYEIEISR